MRLLTEYCKQISLNEYLSTKVKVKLSTIKVDNKNFYDVIREEVKRLGPNADLNHIDVSEVTDFYIDNMALFEKTDFCGDVSKWDVSKCTSFVGLFYSCTNFNCDISNWDMSNADTTSSMFLDCKSFNQNISGWQMPKLKFAYRMFENCKSFNQPIVKWEKFMSKNKNIETLGKMFKGCSSFNQDLSSWDLKSVGNVEDMFKDSAMEDKHLPKFFIYEI